MRHRSPLRASVVALLLAITAPTARPPVLAAPAQADTRVGRFGVFEASFKSSGKYANAYAEVTATATVSRPGDGGAKPWTAALFWDGGDDWKLRLSPDAVGEWSYRVTSDDPGLNGAEGRFTCEPSDRPGGIRPMADHPYHFQRQDGSPVWLCGDTAWAAFAALPKEKLDRAAVFKYIDRRAAQGFNYVHTMLVSSAGDGHEVPNAGRNEGGPIFESFEAETLNPAYFREVDARVRYMNDKGITSGVVLNWGYGEPSWHSFKTDEARLRFARYAAARYGAFDVTFIVSGEWDDFARDAGRELFSRIGRAVMGADPHGRPRGIHPAVTPGQSEMYAGEDWCHFGDYQQTYDDLHARALAARDHDKPVVNAEYAYYLRDADGDGRVDKENSETLDRIRHCTWDVVMAGAYVVTGFGTTYYGGWREPGPFDPAAAKNVDWEDDAAHVRTLFTSLEWWKLQPRDDLLTGPGVRYCLADPGRTYVAYGRDVAGEMSLALGDGGAAPAEYAVRRYDPREGTFANLPAHRASGPVTLQAPDARDWVFVLRRTE